MRRVSGDDGVTAVLVAVTMTALFGLGALVVDVGTWYAEGRQLQNGAQAAAVAVAQTCVRTGTCDAGTSGTAATFAEENAVDGTARVVRVCGTAPGLSACPTAELSDEKMALEDLYGCKPLPTAATGPASAPYVEVHTETRTASGASRMPPLLIRAVLPEDAGTLVRACARASYGAPASITTALPLTISACEYKLHTGAVLPGGAPKPELLEEPGPYSPAGPWPAEETVLLFKDPGGDPKADPKAGPKGSSGPPAAVSGACPTSPAGMDAPGAFGWLKADEGTCVATTTTSGGFLADTGLPPKCDNRDLLDALIGQTLEIPVFVSVTGSGAKAKYTMGGFASFVLKDYRFPGAGSPGGTAPCDPSQTCISGFFTRPAGSTGVIARPPTGSVAVIQITG